MNEFINTCFHIGFSGVFFAPLLATITFGAMALFKRDVREREISYIARGMSFFYLAFAALLFVCWLMNGRDAVKWDIGTIYKSSNFRTDLSLVLDAIGVVFLAVTAILSNIIILFSRRYLHRDPGFRRFYLVLSLFIFGMTLLFCAGSFDLIFAAWEIIGLASFLLIGFYWHRPAAVINAKRAYFIYRTCDVGLLASALLSHLIWHDPNLLYDLMRGTLDASWRAVPLWEQWTLCIVILLPVIGKSAQFPVSYWLPKAMEGPTPSSAIFYGSISVHAGVFLLLRTSSLWYQTAGFTVVIFVLGMATAVSATLFGRVQASIKGQIGYASVAQVGLMLCELALGWWNVVLVHFIGNAFLRCFQLLVSASVVAEQLQIHGALEGKQLIHRWSIESWIPKSMRGSLYVFAVNEGFLEATVAKLIIEPVLRLAARANWVINRRPFAAPMRSETVSLRSHSWFVVVVISLTVINMMLGPIAWLPIFFLAAALLLALGSMGENASPLSTLHLLCLSQMATLLALTINHEETRGAVRLFLCGFLTSWFIVYDAYSFLLSRRTVNLAKRFSGLYSQFPLASSVAFIGILGLLGFPFATTFLAEDILLEHAVRIGFGFVVLLSVVFVINGITLVRMHARIFFGSREAEGYELELDFSSFRALCCLGVFAGANALAFVLV